MTPYSSHYLECLYVGSNRQPVSVALNSSLQVPPLVLYLSLLAADMLSLWPGLRTQSTNILIVLKHCIGSALKIDSEKSRA
jgi:hypothetical protein